MESSLETFVLGTNVEIDSDVKSLKVARMSPHFLCLGFLHTDLSLLVLAKKNLIAALSNVLDFYWEDEIEDEAQTLYLIVHFNDGEMSKYQLNLDSSVLEKVHCLTCHQISVLLAENETDYTCTSELEFLSFSKNVAAFVLDKLKFVLFDVGREQIVRVLTLTLFVEIYHRIQFYLERLFILTEKCIQIVSLTANCEMKNFYFQDMLNMLQMPNVAFSPTMFSIGKSGQKISVASRENYVLLFEIPEKHFEGHKSQNSDIVLKKPRPYSDPTSRSLDSMLNLQHPVDDFWNKNKTEKTVTKCEQLWKRRLSLLENKSFHACGSKGDSLDRKILMSLVAPPMEFATVCGLQNSISYAFINYEVELKNPYQKMFIFKIINLNTGSEIKTFQFKEPYVLVEGAYFTHPNLLLTKHHISAMIWKDSEEKLINKFISYSNAAIADNLSTLNNWHSVNLPLSILNLGLKNHQLDTVSFFLKNKTNAIKLMFRQGQSNEKEMNDQIEELISISEMVLAVIQENLGKNDSIVFAKQLLKINMNYLNGLLQQTVEIQVSSCSCLRIKIIQTLITYLIKFRQYLGSLKIQTKILNSLLSVNYSTRIIYEVEEKWKAKEFSVVIEDATLRRFIPIYQMFILKTKRNYMQCSSSWCLISSDVKSSLIKYLRKEDFSMAFKFMKNMGLNIANTIYEMCMSTTDSVLQGNLISYLRSREMFNKSDLESINKLIAIKETFTCSSFTRSVELRNDDSSLWKSKWSCIEGFPILSVLQVIKIPSFTPNETDCYDPQKNWEKMHYSNLAVDWLKKLFPVQVELILIDGYLSSRNLDFDQFLNQHSDLWLYYLYFNDDRQIGQLLEKRFCNINDGVTNMKDSSTVLKITHHDIEQQCSAYVREKIIHSLYSFGIFPSTGDFDVTKMIHLTRELCQDESLMSLLPSLKLGKIEFSGLIVEHLLRNNLINVLYEYIDFFNSSENMTYEITLDSWLPFLLKIKLIEKQNHSFSLILDCSTVNLHISSILNESVGTLNVEEEHVLTSLASNVYSNDGFQSLELNGENIQLKNFQHTDRENLQNIVPFQDADSYSYLKAMTCQLKRIEIDIDATISELLKDHWAFDWRRKCALIHSFPIKDIANFSQGDLMKIYGHQCELNFMYYLNCGRPSFAYIKFTVQEIIHKKVTYLKRLNASCALASGLALQNFCDGEILAATVAFIELLERSSTWLRLNLVALQLTKNTLVQENSKNDNENINRQAESLQSVINGINRKYALSCKRLLDPLEKLTRHNCCDFTKYSVLRLLHWKVPLTLYHYNCLQLSSSFLVSCAEESNWIMFTIFSQYYQFPLEQVLNVLPKFQDPVIREHLRNSFFHLCYQYPKSSDQFFKQNKSSCSPRDTRCRLYDKIGLAKKLQDNQDSAHCEISKEHEEAIDKEIMEVLSNSTDLDFLLNESCIEELFGVILKAHHTQSSRSLLLNSFQMENPVLIIVSSCSLLATSTLEQLCMWLTLSADHITKTKILSEIFRAVNSHTWIIDDLLIILKVAIWMQRFSLIAQGFYLFQHDSPLFHLLRFLEVFFEKCDKEESVQNLERFLGAIKEDNSFNVNNLIGDKAWVEKASVALISESIIACKRSIYILDFLEIIVSKKLNETLATIELPNFSLLLTLHKCILNESIHFPYEDFLRETCDVTFDTKCRNLLDKLIFKGSYVAALSFAEASGLEKDIIIISQLHEEFIQLQNSPNWFSTAGRLEFWSGCLHRFVKFQVSTKYINKFFMEHRKYAKSFSEKFLLLKICLSYWNENANISKDELEIEMWKNRLNAEIHLEFTGKEGLHQFIELASTFSSSLQSFRLKEEILLQRQLTLNANPCQLNSIEERQVLKRLIQQELADGNIFQAYYLSQLFMMEEKDLEIIFMCMDLAEGKTKINDVQHKMKQILRSSQRNPSSPFHSLVEKYFYDQDLKLDERQAVETSTAVLSALYRLGCHCHYGIKYTALIFLYYWISIILDLSYQFVVQRLEDIELLGMVLKCTHDQKYIIVKEFIRYKKISPWKTACFITDEFIQKFKRDFSVGESNYQLYWTKDQLQDFVRFSSFCSDPTILGQTLFEAANSLQNSNMEIKNMFSLEIKLIIKAHECFSNACNTEGIAQVLQKTKYLIKKLITAEEFSYIIHLLCGIGRFSEMLYVFDVLLDQHQFELLLKKGVEKNNQLKQALVNYMTYYHPFDKEMFTMVAFRFRLCRHIGEMHEEIAHQQLRQINYQKLTNSRSCIENLESILQYFIDAAENFIKSGCEQHAIKCTSVAQLIALQIFLLSTGKKILNLSEKEVEDFIINHRSFLEANLVAQVYNEQHKWPMALYKNVIMQGDMKYLDDFHSHIGITRSLIESITYRIQRENISTEQYSQNLNKMLDLLKDKAFKVIIAKQLGVRNFDTEHVQCCFFKDIGLIVK